MGRPGRTAPRSRQQRPSGCTGTTPLDCIPRSATCPLSRRKWSTLASSPHVVRWPDRHPSAIPGRFMPDQVTAHCNGAQPPMSWLVRQADLLGGQLVGGLVHGRAYVRFDGVQLPPEAARVLGQRMAADWPATGETDALAAAVVETWTSWTARQPSWTGTGPDV